MIEYEAVRTEVQDEEEEKEEEKYPEKRDVYICGVRERGHQPWHLKPTNILCRSLIIFMVYTK